MNISLSYNWIKEYIKVKKSPQEFAREFSLHSQTIDRVHEVSAKWKNVITVKITALEKHPNADTLRLATVDTGSKTLRVVCGAPNIAVGQIVPLVQEGGEVMGPERKPFTVKKANIRGVESNGMLCSKRELGLSEEHSGIFVLPKDTKIGVTLESILHLNDHIFDIEVTSNRPDAHSVIGIAREASAIFKTPFIHKESKTRLTIDKNIKISVMVKEPKLCKRYQAIVVKDIQVDSSPLWMQMRLMASGIRPINNIVDITNYVLLEYGQPMHAFDYDKIQDKTIVVRRAKSGEKIFALDGKSYGLLESDLVIADSKNPMAIAGVMGGNDLSVGENTKSIVFESAIFDEVSIRKTSRRLHLFSESSNLFEKGLSPHGTEQALARALDLAQKIAGAKKTSAVIDIKKYTAKKIFVSLSAENVTRLLGISIKPTAIISLLKSLGCRAFGGKIIKVQIPWYRSLDLVEEVDIIEEVARMYGYHNIASRLPEGLIPQIPIDKIFAWEYFAKNALQGIGMTEIYTYSMVSREMIEKAGFEIKKALKIFNPLSSDLEYMRPTILSSVLNVVAENEAKKENIKIFEIARIYAPKENSLPEESIKLALCFCGTNNIFYEAKGTIEFLAKKMGVSFHFSTGAHGEMWKKDAVQDIMYKEVKIGEYGLLSEKVTGVFGIKKRVAIAILDFMVLSRVASLAKEFIPLPEYPGIERDIAVVLEKSISWQKIEKAVSVFHPLIREVKFVSVYEGKELEGKKSLALRIVVRSQERTLKSEEADLVVASLLKKLKEEFGAQQR